MKSSPPPTESVVLIPRVGLDSPPTESVVLIPRVGPDSPPPGFVISIFSVDPDVMPERFGFAQSDSRYEEDAAMRVSV